MGKRELLLIAGFVLLGAIVYQVTAPPSDGAGLSPTRTIERLRRLVAGNAASVVVERSETLDVPAEIDTLRVENVAEVRVTGEARANLSAALRVRSTGLDPEDARRLARLTAIERRRADGRLVLGVTYPAEGRQRAILDLRVPARLALVLVRTTRAEIEGVGTAQLDDTRGELLLRAVREAVQGRHSGGRLRLSGAGRVDLAVGRATVEVEDLSAGGRIESRGGTLRLRAIRGRTVVQGRGTAVEIAGASGPLELDLIGGRCDVRDLTGAARITARDMAMVRVHLARVAPLTITSEGDIDLALPPRSGVELDAHTEEGSISLPPDAAVPVVARGRGQHAAGLLNGGGALVRLRSTEGTIVVR
ncbi:MAG TPA: hypothetical protein VNI83_14150 [Vicinamibacterales bacterium]|nr:hypothetical protein [Vicinamibacterales bacterium]